MTFMLKPTIYSNFQQQVAKNASLLVLLSSILGFALWSLRLGQDANWDLQNYHYYNPYALFSGRLEYDIAPAQQQTYLNPAVDLLPFLIIQHFPPWVFGIVLGAWQGLNLWLLFLIGRELLVRIKFPNPGVWAVCCAIVGVKGAASASEVGATYHDLTLSVFILAAVYLYFRAWGDLSQDRGRGSWQTMAFSGLCLGIAAGLKLTFALYALGMGAAILVVQVIMLRRYRWLIPFGLAALAGLLMCAGPWMWYLWQHYDNPMFPLYNGIFHSPYYPLYNTTDLRFIPKSIVHAISFPLRFTKTEHAGSELGFRDFRVAILYISTFLFGVYALFSFGLARLAGSRVDTNLKLDHSVVWMLVFIWVTYLAWIKMFAVYRYLVCIELLSPLVFVTLVGGLIKTKYSQPLFVVCLLFLVFNTRVPDWGRLPWAEDFFGVHPPAMPWTDKSVVLIASGEPLAYMIPSFPKSVRFVRIEGNFITPEHDTALTDRIRSVSSNSLGDLYLLTHDSEVNKSVVIVNQFLQDHVAALGDCEPVITRIESSIALCRLSVSKK